MEYLRNVYGTPAAQSDPIVGRESEMVQNSADGFTFQLDGWGRFERFLILGSEGGTYYSDEPTLTLENATCVRDCVSTNPQRAAEFLLDVSENGRAAKQGPTLFALAMLASFGGKWIDMRPLLQRICRTGTSLLNFVAFADEMRGWGPKLRKSVASWYEREDVAEVAYQCVKYRQRDGWSHRDAMRLSHPKAPTDAHRALYDWVTAGEDGKDWRKIGPIPELDIIGNWTAVQSGDENYIVPMLDEQMELGGRGRITWEMIPSEARTPKVWSTLLPTMPQTALLRQLPTLTRSGVLSPMSDAELLVSERLGDVTRYKNVHPLSVLMAWYTYKEGRSVRGSSTWEPNASIVQALEGAFLLAFNSLPDLDARIYVGLDVSGSMGSPLNGTNIPCREASAALSMTLAKQARQIHIGAFASKDRWRLENTYMKSVTTLVSRGLGPMVAETADIPMGATDCALPMLDALENKMPVDTFVIITDSETWSGRVHPCEALKRYRKEMNIPAKLVVVGMTATDFTIADPADAGTMDVVGFDTAVPQLIERFIGA